jgi:hypothetical protein
VGLKCPVADRSITTETVRAVVLPSRESARFTVLLLHIFARARRRAADNPGMAQRRDKNGMPPSRCAPIGNFPRQQVARGGAAGVLSSGR